MPNFRTLFGLAVLAGTASAASTPVPEVPGAIVVDERLLVGGQPDEAALRQAAEAGYRVVVNLRTDEEPVDFDPQAVAEELGMRYLRLPVAGADGLTPANVAAFGELLESIGEQPALMHCASGNRVGALFALHAGREGMDVESAIEYGRARGLTGLEDAVRERLEHPDD